MPQARYCSFYMGWSLNPDEQTVFVYSPKQETKVLDRWDEVLPVPSLLNEILKMAQDGEAQLK